MTLVELSLAVLIVGLLASVAVPSYARARRRTRTHVCINNLRLIEQAKESYAMENRLNDGDAVGDLTPYMRGGALPTCLASGNYTVGVVGVRPVCSIEGHALP